MVSKLEEYEQAIAQLELFYTNFRQRVDNDANNIAYARMFLFRYMHHNEPDPILKDTITTILNRLMMRKHIDTTDRIYLIGYTQLVLDVMHEHIKLIKGGGKR